MQTGGNYEWACQNLFAPVSTLQLMKMHKYLHWADKKLHSVFFIENKDQINEDLMADFADGDSVKTGLSKHQGPPAKKPIINA